MVRWARQQVGLPPQGLQPEEAQEFFLGAMINLLMPCMLLHPKLGPQLVEQLGTQLPEQVSGLSDSELERGVRAFLMSTPHRLLNLRFAAVYLASWLGIEDEDSVMTYLVSPERWPLHNVSPVGRTKPGPTQVPAIAEIFSSLLPLPRSQRVIKGILLRGFVKGSRTILPQLGEEQATWEQITEIWNALFPEWRFDHWRNLRKAHEYSLLQKQADGQQSTLN